MTRNEYYYYQECLANNIKEERELQIILQRLWGEYNGAYSPNTKALIYTKIELTIKRLTILNQGIHALTELIKTEEEFQNVYTSCAFETG